jgi:ABC-2 type transport system permease protein
VRLSAGEWFHMTLLILIALIPFAGLGIVYGHLLTTDSVGPAMGGTTAILSLFGGAFFPVQNGALLVLAKLLPSYWLVQAGHIGVGGEGWPAMGVIVVAAWAVALAAASMWAYRRDTGRT